MMRTLKPGTAPRPLFVRDSAIITQVLSGIKHIEADDDWDGISSALQVKRHYPSVEINISGSKCPDSTADTLVLDKQTHGDGWVVDHHPASTLPQNVLSFSMDGKICTSSQVYLLLPAKDDTDMFMAAIAEITEGLDSYGLRNGVLRDFLDKYPEYASKSKMGNQYLKPFEIYDMADIIALISNRDQAYALALGERLSPDKVKSADGLIAMLSPEFRNMVKRYFGFIAQPTDRFFKPFRIDDHEVMIADSNSMEFPMQALSKALLEHPANYVLLKGDRVSIRTQNQKLVDDIVKKLGDHVESHGGRVGWYGMILTGNLDYREFLNLL